MKQKISVTLTMSEDKSISIPDVMYLEKNGDKIMLLCPGEARGFHSGTCYEFDWSEIIKKDHFGNLEKMPQKELISLINDGWKISGISMLTRIGEPMPNIGNFDVINVAVFTWGRKPSVFRFPEEALYKGLKLAS